MGYIPTKSVVLNGRDYIVDGGVQVTPLASWADPLRVVGNPRRGDRTNASQWVQEDWSSGLGYESMTASPIDDARQPDPSWYGFYDSTCETRWKGQVTLPGLQEAVTTANSSHSYSRFTTATNGATIVPHMYGGDEESIQRDNTGVFSTFTSIKDLTSGYTNFKPRCDVKRSDGGTLFLGGDNAGNIPAKVVYIAASGTVTDLSPSGNLTGIALSAINFKNILYAIVWVAASDKLQLNQSTNDGAAWTVVNTNLNLGYEGTNRRYAQLFQYLDANGQPAIYLDVDDALYILDLGNNEWGKIITHGELPTQTGDDVSFRPIVWNGNAYIPHNNSIIEFNYNGSWRDISPFTSRKVPSSISVGGSGSYISAATSDAAWLYIAEQDGTTSPSVWAYDGVGWHFIWNFTGVGVCDIRELFVWQNTLAIMYDDLGAANSHYVVKIGNITQNPLSTSSKKYASTGYMVTPFFDGGMTEVDCAWLQMGMGFKGLDTTANNNEKIQTQTALGYSDTYESASGTVLTWYSDSSVVQKFLSGAGMDSPVIKQKHTLTRGSTNTKTPVMFYPVVYYDKAFPKLHKYTFIVDVKKTANQGAYSSSDEQDVLRGLEATFAKTPQSTFKFPGIEIYLSSGVTVDYVRIVDIQTIAEVDGDANALSPRMDSGRVQVTVEAKI